MRLLAFYLALFVGTCLCQNVFLNIHVKLGSTVELIAEQYNAAITANAPHNGINLTEPMQPHVTLYLTEFLGNHVDDIIAASQKVVERFPANCNVTLLNAFVQGAYAMWNSSVPACLQFMSDALVNETFLFAVPNQPIPPWVLQLPEPERSLKIAMIKRYGSPNVFSQFQPHVTLAYDDTASDSLNAAVESAHVVPVQFVPHVMALGSVGPYGTVLRGKDIAQFDI